MYAAGEMFMTMRKKLINQGKVVRGKVVEPVKSCLNFIKSVLYPLKVNFEKRNFTEVMNPEIDPRFDANKFQENLRSQVRQQYDTNLERDLKDIINDLPKKIYKMLKNESPFRNDKVMLKRIYISCMLSFVNKLTLCNKDRKKIREKDKYDDPRNILTLYTQND